MYKVLLAILLAVILSLLVVTGFFMIFSFYGLPQLATEFVGVVESTQYWIGLGIFSLLFLLFFTLPLTLMIIKE
jgi:hypothetical protein